MGGERETQTTEERGKGKKISIPQEWEGESRDRSRETKKKRKKEERGMKNRPRGAKAEIRRNEKGSGIRGQSLGEMNGSTSWRNQRAERRISIALDSEDKEKKNGGWRTRFGSSRSWSQNLQL